MATKQCIMVPTLVGVSPGIAVQGSSSQVQGKRMQAFMRQTSTASSNRISLLQALTQQTVVQSQRSLQSLFGEIGKYVNMPRTDARSLEESFMSVPDLETIPYNLIRQAQDYEIREVLSYVVAETTMPGKSGFDIASSGQSFNTLAAYLFGKNEGRIEMSMTTPVVTQKGEARGEKMDMTTPVIQQASGEGQWRMSFVLPAKYNEGPPKPIDSKVTIRRIPAKKVAVAVFSGYVSDNDVKNREQALRRALLKDPVLRVKLGAQPEVSQFNPPFTPPFMRRNEISLEIEDVC